MGPQEECINKLEESWEARGSMPLSIKPMYSFCLVESRTASLQMMLPVPFLISPSSGSSFFTLVSIFHAHGFDVNSAFQNSNASLSSNASCLPPLSILAPLEAHRLYARAPTPASTLTQTQATHTPYFTNTTPSLGEGRWRLGKVAFGRLSFIEGPARTSLDSKKTKHATP